MQRCWTSRQPDTVTTVRLVTDADGRTGEVRAEAIAAVQQEEWLKAAIAGKEADMAAAAAEKELQAGGEVRELQAATDEQSKQCAAASTTTLYLAVAGSCGRHCNKGMGGRAGVTHWLETSLSATAIPSAI